MIPPVPGDTFAPGQVLNNTYEVEGLIGRGGTGEAYRARNLVTGRVVAIKALSRQLGSNEAYLGLMRREAQMRDVVHDAVVRYWECSRSDDGHVFLVMDLIDGPSLQQEMAARRLDARELLMLAHRVAEGLAAAHARGIVHRDLSPDNLILRGGDPDQATLIDFGIAKDTAAGARTIVGNDFAGKYEYAAPEQVEGRADARSDLYALGATLLAAFRGEVPFVGTTPGEIVRRKAQPLDVHGVPEPLARLIAALAAPDPAARPASAAEAAVEIERMLRPTRVMQRGAGPRPGRVGPSERGGGLRLTASLVVVVLLVGVGAGGWWAWREGLLGPLLAGVGLGSSDLLDPVEPAPSPFDPLQVPDPVPDPEESDDSPVRPAPASEDEPPAPPIADPYTLRASVVDEPSLAGHAPDLRSAETLARAFAAASGAEPPTAALTLAGGVPSDAWVGGLVAMIGAAGLINRWTVAAEDARVRVSGLAPDDAARDRVGAMLREAATAAGLELDLAIAIATDPDALLPAALAPALAATATCGPLTLVDPPTGGYGPGAPVTVTGDLAAEADRATVRAAVVAAARDRPVELRTTLLGEPICKVRRVLPNLGPGPLVIRLAEGATGAERTDGRFRPGENPVADILLPADLADLRLRVAYVVNAGDVWTTYNLLPNRLDEEDRVEELGEVEDGTRRIRVLFSVAEVRAAGADEGGNRLFGFNIPDDEPGTSALVAVLSDEALIPTRGPRTQSPESFAAEVARAMAADPGRVVAVSTQVMEALP